MRIKNEKRQAKYPAAYICPWRNWITQRIPIPENGGSNPFGQAKIKGHTWGVLLFWSAKNPKGFEADRQENATVWHF